VITANPEAQLNKKSKTAPAMLAHVASKSAAQAEKRTNTESEAGQASAKRSKEALDKVAREIEKIAKLEAETKSVQYAR